MKVSELNAAIEVINQLGLFGRIESYLDVGTCTARYPIELSTRGALKPDAKVVALDEESDCIEFSRAKLSDHHDIQHRIDLVTADFLREGQEDLKNESFDLITCMLGTLSHFGGPSVGAFGLQRSGRLKLALRKMQCLLRKGGVLLLGNWSDRAREDGRFLRIYRDQDQLRDWTPSQAELRTSLLETGLEVHSMRPIQPDPGIDLFVCRKS